MSLPTLALKLILPKIYPLTDARLSTLSLSEQVEQMLIGGALLIQLRDKHLSGRELFDEAKRSVKLCREYGAKLIVNDRVDIALAAGADGIHLGQDDLSPKGARKLLGEKAIIGLSTHSVEQALDALNEPINYIAIGPIFATSSKTETSPVVGREGVKAVREAIADFPLVAIGGINTENLQDVLFAGADSVALISAVCSKDQAISSLMSEIIAKAK